MSILLIVVLVIAFFVNYFFAFIFLHGETSGRTGGEIFKIIVVLIPGAALCVLGYIIIRILLDFIIRGFRK